jgi:predicted ester cyclase
MNAGKKTDSAKREEERQMSEETGPKQLVERHMAAFNAHDPDGFPWIADIEWEAPGAQLRGREQALGFIGAFWEAFPDARIHVVRLIGEGSLLAGEGRFTGTHDGTMRTPEGEIPPTGRQVEFRWMSMYEVRGDEVAAEHLYFDQAELMAQLGVAPATAPS